MLTLVESSETVWDCNVEHRSQLMMN